MGQKKEWCWAGLFIIALVISMPFYVADVYAVSVSITKNGGEKGIEGFIDADGDIWTVGATINGVEEVAAEKVEIKVGGNKAPFDTCSDSALGVACEYKSPLNEGIRPGVYDFSVLYNYQDEFGVEKSVGDSDSVKADGEAPEIRGLTAKQEGEKVKLGFLVEDKPEAYCVGLEKIEIVEVERGVLQTIGNLEEKCTYNYGESEFEGILQASLGGEGKKWIKVKAVDRLGHERTSGAVGLETDFVAPEIKEINFEDFGDFIGQYEAETDIEVKVVEKGEVLKVVGDSEQAKIEGEEALCAPDEEVEDLWVCRWEKVEVLPAGSVSVKVEAIDGKGNKAERVLSKSFTVDDDEPRVAYFGAERTFGGVGYVRKGENRIILKVDEKGVGMDEEGIRANLGGLGGEASDEPDNCTSTESTYDCYWDVNYNGGGKSVLIGLSTFKDKVGNEGQKPETEVMVDSSGPKVEKIEVYGLSEAGKKDYFQSNDVLRIEMQVAEGSGLVVLVDLNEAVNEAEEKFPETSLTKEHYPSSGWQKFTEEDCKRKEGGKWVCELETQAIKSGPDSSVELEIKVLDTAGNEAEVWEKEPRNIKSGSGGKYAFELLGLETEESPDFWEFVRSVPLGGESAFVDLDITSLTQARMPMEVTLKNEVGAEAIKVELMECRGAEERGAGGRATEGRREREEVGEVPVGAESGGEGSETEGAPALSRWLLYGGVSPEGKASPLKVKILLELEPFEGREFFGIGAEKYEGETFEKEYREYKCLLKIYSKVGKKAIKTGELQEVKVKVPFGFTKLGALDENVEEEIRKAREGVTTGFWGVMGTLEKVVRVVNYLVTVVNMGASAIALIQGVKMLGDAIPLPAKGSAVLFCLGLDSVARGIDKSLGVLQPVVAVLSCSGQTGIGWYDAWREFIFIYYNVLLNIEIGRAPDSYFNEGGRSQFHQARDIYDNLYLSIAGLCVPGIIHNLDKYRQIKCRTVYCLENEVKSGLVTIETCGKLEGLLTCKYFIGELWYLIPFSQFYDKVINGLWNIFKDPLAVLHTATIAICVPWCLMSGPEGGAKLSSTCNTLYWVWDMVSWIEGLVGFITTIVQEFESGGLKYCDMVL